MPRHRKQEIEESSAVRLRRLAPAMAKVAQKVYDAWEQDEEGFSEDYASGGICDDIASEIASVLSHAKIEAVTHHDESENHTFVYAKLPDGVYSVDIPFGVYETGGHYNYRKRPGVTFEADHVVIDRVCSLADAERWGMFDE